jgi:hypothetical protein
MDDVAFVMLVARTTCHFPSRARQWASFTLKTSELFGSFSSPVGSSPSVIGFQPWPVGGTQDRIWSPDPA